MSGRVEKMHRGIIPTISAFAERLRALYKCTDRIDPKPRENTLQKTYSIYVDTSL